MLAQPKVLLVDDDPTCRLVIGQCLVSAGYRVIEASTGTGLTALAQAENPALVILDVGMPDCDGWEALADLRRHGSAVPVLMLTGRVEVSERIKGLLDGADDYVVKGCDLGEFLARVHALLRRAGSVATQPRWLRIGAVVVDLESKSALRGSEPLSLTRTEYLLLKLFAQNVGRPVSREQMLDRVWGYHRLPETRTIDTHLWRLRKKIAVSEEAEPWLRNVSGLGYVMTCQTGHASAPPADWLPRAA